MPEAATLIATGVYSAKREDCPYLLSIVRQVIADDPDIGPTEALKAALDIVNRSEDKELLMLEGLRYTLNNLYRRCQPKEDAQGRRNRTARGEKAAREIIESSIKLWTWRIPVIGKALPDCTFGELAEAAPVTNKFLAKLATQGAPGTLVREIFKSEKQLQIVWTSFQNI